MKIETERLVLRDFVEDDWEVVHEYASDPDVVRFTRFGPNTEEETRAFIQRKLDEQQADPRTHYGLAITLNPQCHLFGACGIEFKSADDRTAVMGYILNRDFWNKGYMTEAAKAMVEFGFSQLKLHRIYLECDTENSASIRVAEKLGMRREAHMMKNKWDKGEWRDSFLYAILENEWQR